jgi:hypothetical protein
MADETTDRRRSALTAALYRVFVALARFCLRHGMPYDAVAEVAKRAFVDVAYKDFTIPGRKPSASRVSLLTGIHRKEVGRMVSGERPEADIAESRIAYSASIIGGWRRDKRFADSRGRPAALPFEGSKSSFSELVKRYGGGDVPARAAFDELARVGAVTKQKDGRIRLQADGYVPSTSSEEALAILGSDVSDLVATIDHNLANESERGFFQRKTAYDDLPEEVIDEILTKIEREGQGVLERVDRYIAKRDRESNPKIEGSGRKRTMFGVYCYVEDAEEED